MSIISKKDGESYLYFKTTSAQKFSVIDKTSNELYELPSVAPTENGQVISVNIDGTSQFVNNTAANALIADQPLVIPTQGAVIISDGISSTGTNFSEDLIIRDYDGIDVYKQLNVNSGLNIQSLTTSPVVMTSGTDDFTINNGQGSRTVFINSSSYEFDNNIISNENVILNQGKSLTLNNDTDVDNVKLYKVNGLNGDFFIDNQGGTKTKFKGASEYDFDNDVKIGDISTTKKLYLNDVEITPSGSGLSAGLLRALNVNQIVPTVAQTYDIVWSNLTAGEQAIWAGGSEPPIASASGNYWNFTKLSAGTQKINWTLPFDFLTANLSFQDLQSIYAIIRLNTPSNISAEGYMWFQIQSQNTPQNAPLYRTRWNYANSASGIISQLGNTYKIYASDAIPLSTAASNTGKGQEVYPLQTKFKSNPVDIEPTSLFSIPFTKFVMSPTGDTTAGYTTANVQSIALNTASNINTYNFDVIAIGFNSVRYNLYFA
jgi:hypothetical protein